MQQKDEDKYAQHLASLQDLFKRFVYNLGDNTFVIKCFADINCIILLLQI